MNKKETAWILWNNMADQLPAAIAAVAILNALAKIPYAESKVLVKYGFKGVVVDSLWKCTENPQYAQMLINARKRKTM